MATTTSSDKQEVVFEWQGKDRDGKIVRGEMRAMGENQVQASLRRQGILPTKIKKRRMSSGKNHTQGLGHLHTSAGHHDEGRCAAAAII